MRAKHNFYNIPFYIAMYARISFSLIFLYLFIFKYMYYNEELLYIVVIIDCFNRIPFQHNNLIFFELDRKEIRELSGLIKFWCQCSTSILYRKSNWLLITRINVHKIAGDTSNMYEWMLRYQQGETKYVRSSSFPTIFVIRLFCPLTNLYQITFSCCG